MIPDLSTYTRYLDGASWPNVLNVGWLEAGHPFEQGTVDPRLVPKLYDIVFGSVSFDARLGELRSPEPCPLCGRAIAVVHDGEEFYLGRSELWIPRKYPAQYFSVSSLLPHYVEFHHYAPPAVFVEAVLAVKLADRYNADRENHVMGYWHNRVEDAGLLDRLK